MENAITQCPVTTPEQWRVQALIVGGTVTVVVGLFWDTAASLVATWYRSATYTHGFLILPISLALIWSRRHQIASLRPTPTPRGLLLLAMLAGAWLLGNLAAVLLVQQLAVVAMLPVLFWTALGTPVTRALLFPLAFLFFAVPIGDSLVPLLQDFTASFMVTALRLSGIPVFWEGRVLATPSGMWIVAEACSGVRYVISAAVFGCLYAAVIYTRWTRRLGFTLASVVAPILTNGVRAYGIVVLSHLSAKNPVAGAMQYVVHRMWGHLVYGWLVFGVMMALLFWLGLRWREPVGSDPAADGQEPLSSAGDSAVAMQDTLGRTCSVKALALTMAGGVALLALAPVSASVMAHRAGTPAVVRATAPSVTLPWQPLAQYTGNWVPRFVGANAELTQSYTSGGQQVQVYMAYYATQRQGAELINAQNTLVDGKQWVQIGGGQARAMVDGRSLAVREITIRSSLGTRLVWSWYWVAGAYTANPYLAKLFQLKARFFGGPQGAAVIALAADYDGRPPATAATLQSFLQHTSLGATLSGFVR